MIHYPVWAIVLFAFQVLHTIYTPKMVEKYENNEFKFGFCFKRRVVALNVGLLVSLFVCYLLVYMGIWECEDYSTHISATAELVFSAYIHVPAQAMLNSYTNKAFFYY